MQTTTIPLNKSKLIGLLLISGLFIATGSWLLSVPPNQMHGIARLFPTLTYVIAPLGILLGLITGASLALKLSDSSPGLILDERGLTDNTNVFAGGFIPWKEIRGFEVRYVSNQKFLYVLLVDREQYLARIPPWKRAFLNLTRKSAPSPVALTALCLNIGFDQLVALAGEHFEKARQGH